MTSRLLVPGSVQSVSKADCRQITMLRSDKLCQTHTCWAYAVAAAGLSSMSRRCASGSLSSTYAASQQLATSSLRVEQAE
jgi:hypothetical protein